MKPRFSEHGMRFGKSGKNRQSECPSIRDNTRWQGERTNSKREAFLKAAGLPTQPDASISPA